MSAKQITFTTPVGRMIGGSLYIGNTENYDGKPLTFADGSPRQEFSFGVAFPKTPGIGHWANEPWMRQFYDCGFANFTNGEPQRHDFAWKITDGDSEVPGKAKQGKPGRRPCDREGYKGHWVIWFGGATAPKLWNGDATQQLLNPDAIKPGYYIQVQGSAKGNTGATPGLYMNHHHVSLQGFGPEIVSGPDVKTAGFGQGVVLPAGASAMPVGGMGGAPAPAPNVPGAMPAPAPSSLPALPIASAPSVPVSAPSASPTLLLTPKALAENVTLELLRANPAWTDDLIVSNGYATRVVAAPAPAPVPLPNPAGSAPAPVPVTTAPAPTVVTPNPAILQMPAPVPAAAALQPTQKLIDSGFTIAQLQTDPAWTEAALRANGYIV